MRTKDRVSAPSHPSLDLSVFEIPILMIGAVLALPSSAPAALFL
jgi:hypothetical protein